MTLYPELTDDSRRELLKTMVLIRTYEEAILREYHADKSPGFDIGAGLVPGEMHLSAGQEPVAAGVCAHLTADDALTASHRPHHLAIAKGVRSVACRQGDAGGQVGAHTSGNGFLPGRQVHLAGNKSRSDVEPGALVCVILPEDRLLVGANQHHGFQKFTTGIVGEFGVQRHCFSARSDSHATPGAGHMAKAEFQI